MCVQIRLKNSKDRFELYVGSGPKRDGPPKVIIKQYYCIIVNVRLFHRLTGMLMKILL